MRLAHIRTVLSCALFTSHRKTVGGSTLQEDAYSRTHIENALHVFLRVVNRSSVGHSFLQKYLAEAFARCAVICNSIGEKSVQILLEGFIICDVSTRNVGSHGEKVFAKVRKKNGRFNPAKISTIPTKKVGTF